jgi:folate-binding protein YgfZ
VIAAVGKFILRRKVTLKPDGERALFGSDAAVAIEGLDRLSIAVGAGRALHLGPRAIAASPAPVAWKRADFEAGIAWLPPAASEKHLAHALGLQRLPALSLKKGCYPGQEIVARTHYLGRNKRALHLLHIGGAAAPGQQVRDDEGQLAGELIDTLGDVDGTLALAVISDERALAPLALQSGDDRLDCTVIRRFDMPTNGTRASG